MDKRPLTVEDLWSIPVVGQPEVDQAGSTLVVPVRTFSMEANEGKTRLWRLSLPTAGKGASREVAPAADALAVEGAPRTAEADHPAVEGSLPTAEPVPLTDPSASSDQPALSPDGTRMAFVRKPGGPASEKDGDGLPRYPDQPQLFLMDLRGGEAVRQTDMPLGVAAPRWFPDGRRLGFLSAVYAEAPGLDDTAERAKADRDSPVKAHVTEDRVYRYWDHWLTDGRVHHVFALNTGDGAVEDLTPTLTRRMSLGDGAAFRIAPDGREIAFEAVRSDPPFQELRFGVYLVRLSDGGPPGPPALLTAEMEGHQERPVYSPDGRWIVYGLQRDFDFYADKVRLVAFDRASGQHRVLTEAWDGSAEGWEPGTGSGEWFFAAEREGGRALCRLELDDEGRAEPPKVVVEGGWYGDPTPRAGRVIATRQSLRAPSEVMGVDAATGEVRALSTFTAEAMRRVDVGQVESTEFVGAEGRRVQMFLVHPPQDRPGGAPYPLVHMIHGGPHGVFGDFWHARWNAQAFAAPGYLVALVNFHGSTGWGQSFTASILGRWGDQPYRDIEAATDHLVQLGLADPDRMAVTGGSYGGYLVSWIASQTGRYRCAVNHAGVCDFQTQYATDITQGRRRSLGGEPWKNIEGLDRWNPFRHANGFSTPMLILHGESDYRVPHAQGLALYNVYQAMGLPSRLVIYPDENHWILKPQNSRHWYGEVLGWLGRWLGRDGAAEAVAGTEAAPSGAGVSVEAGDGRPSA